MLTICWNSVGVQCLQMLELAAFVINILVYSTRMLANKFQNKIPKTFEAPLQTSKAKEKKKTIFNVA